jgi:carboxymethylenebutenolidase
VALSLVAGLAAATDGASAADLPVTETNVEIKTPDGTCDAAFIRPTTGSHPAVLVWPDAFGLRPAMRDIGKRIAAEGYSVLVPNPFYRIAKSPIPGLEDPSKIDFSNAADLAKLRPLMGSITAAGAAERDSVAFVAFLDAQRFVDTAKKVGTQGYCMGGALVMRTAASVPNRVGAVGSFHGGAGLVNDTPNSTDLLAPKMRARLYVAIAGPDDARSPQMKDKLRAAFAAANLPAEVEVYSSRHGWCVPDNPPDAAGPIYNKADADRAWAKLVALYKTGLA